MPQVSPDVHVPIAPHLAFTVSQTHGEVRHRRDPFIREQHFLALLPFGGGWRFTPDGEGGNTGE